MLEMIMEKNVIYVVAGGVALLGILSKCISNVTLKRLMHASGNMSKSNHPLMKLVRAKFEHACMISDKVENVQVFVDKYLLEYKVLGMRLHSWQKLETTAAVFCMALGLLGALGEYTLNGMNDEVLQTGVICWMFGIFVYLLHFATDEKYRMEVTRNYMVDYLENVCLHRYEKTMLKEKEEIIRPQPGKEVPTPPAAPEILPPAMPEPYEVPDVTPPIKAAVPEHVKEKKEPVKKEEKKPDKDILIRQILEEFMA